MWCIDRDVHTYFNSLNQLQNNQAGTPTNPISNIKGGALGYFSAHSLRSRKVVIP
jgi:glutaminase